MEKRNALSSDEVISLSQKIFQNFVAAFLPKAGQNIHIFLSIEKFKEIDTQFFINYFFKKNINVFVPKVVYSKMKSVQIHQDSLFSKNKWDILEPINPSKNTSDFDFVITPLLYCDFQGNRVGYGKGFYDCFFSEINSDALKIGISFFPPEEKIDDVSEFDIPLDYLVTPVEVLSFTGS